MPDLQDPKNPAAEEPDPDETVIELTDVAEYPDMEEEPIELVNVVSEHGEGNGEEILELTEIVRDGAVPAPGTEQDTGTERPASPEGGQGYPAGESSGLQLTGTGEVTREQIEAALVEVIEKRYAHTIDSLLRETVEAVLEREIRDLREKIIGKLNGQGRF